MSAPTAPAPAPTPASPVATPEVKKERAKPKSIGEVFQYAGKQALRGGLPGAAAMVAQVGSLMWMRTTMNYQYR